MKRGTRQSLFAATLPPKGTHLELLRFDPKESVEVVICSRTVELYGGHWDQARKRTVACQLGPKLCPHHLAQLPYRVYGFVHVFELFNKRHFCVMMTSDGVHNLNDAVEPFGHMRGLQVSIKRRLNRQTQPYVFAAKGLWPEEKMVAPARSCEPTVRRVWHFEGLVDPRAVQG